MKINLDENEFSYEIEVVCTNCNGTGLYQGMLERKESAVVCWSCKGTGKITYKNTLELFKQRKVFINDEVKRVFDGTGGYVLNAEDYTTSEGVLIEFSKYGCTYEEWLGGKEAGYVESLCCPMQANQGIAKDVEGFEDVCETLNNGYINMFAKCKGQCNKKACWDRLRKGLSNANKT